MFKDGSRLHYLHKGSLCTVELETNATRCTNLGVKATELLAFAGNSIYFKDEKLNVHFVDTDWVKDAANLSKLTKHAVFTSSSVLYARFESDVVTNRIATWVSPYTVKVFPPLNQSSIDLVASFGLEQVSSGWSIEGQAVNALYAERSLIVTWSLLSGKILSTNTATDWKGFVKHSDWEGFTLMHKVLGTKTAEGTQSAIWRQIAVHA